MSDDEDHEYEASIADDYETDVILLDGTIKKDYKILLFNKVREEKERIWKSENQQGPPGLDKLVLVIIGQNGEEKVMNDEKKIEEYLDDLTHGTIKFVHQSGVGKQ
ncbi:hypothetical protein BsWGS_17185 [Bradybaena similaris]